MNLTVDYSPIAYLFGRAAFTELSKQEKRIKIADALPQNKNVSQAKAKLTKYQRCRAEGRCYRCHRKKDGPHIYCEPCKQIRKELAVLAKPKEASALVAARKK